MASFKDRQDRSWSIDFTLGSLARVKSETGVDLLTLHVPDSPALAMLRDDPVMLLQVLCVQLRPQFQERGISEQQFADALQEEHVWGAVEALLLAMVDYYPPAKRTALQPLMQRVISAARNVSEKTTRQLQQATMSIDLDDFQQQIERSIVGNSTGSLPASLGSTPDR